MSCAPFLGKIAPRFTKPKRYVDRVFIHCSATSNPNVDAHEIDQWHRGPKRGYSCIGYHYVITTDARLQLGRNLERTPAAQAPHNAGTISICVNGLHQSDFTTKQFEVLIDLCKQIKAALPEITFHGHTEVSAKTCPVFDYRRVLGLDSQGRMVGTQEIAEPKPHEITIHRVTLFRHRNANHSDMWIARALLMLKTHRQIDNEDEFHAVTRLFQEDNDLVPDGIIGPKTWAELER